MKEAVCPLIAAHRFYGQKKHSPVVCYFCTSVRKPPVGTVPYNKSGILRVRVAQIWGRWVSGIEGRIVMTAGHEVVHIHDEGFGALLGDA